MDKAKTYRSLAQLTQLFTSEGEEWELKTEPGVVDLFNKASKARYSIDRDESSLPNLPIMIAAVTKERPVVEYKLLVREDKGKCRMIIKTSIEVLEYFFRRVPPVDITEEKKELKEFNESLNEVPQKLPFYKVYRFTKWKEYGLYDMETILDYSELKFKYTPLIFASPLNMAGYVSIAEKTATSCKLLIKYEKEFIGQEHIVSVCIYPMDKPCEEPKPIIPPPDKKIQVFSSHEEVREEVKNGKKYVIYQEDVIDIEPFAAVHPGLAKVFEGLLGKEISRWFHGSEGVDGKSHAHSEEAIKILRYFKIGKIEDPIKEDFFRGIEPGKSIVDYNFVSEEQEGVTDVHILVKLTHPTIMLAPMFSNVESFGRYFTIFAFAKKIWRNYCCVFCSSYEISKQHQLLWKAVENKTDYKRHFENIETANSRSVSFILRATGKFSTWFAQEAREKTEFILNGPFVMSLTLILFIGKWSRTYK